MADSIHQLLDDLDLGKYRGVFDDNEIDLLAAAHLSDDDLKELGLPLGPRRKFLAAAGSLDTVSLEPADGTAGSAPPVEAAGERRQVTALFTDISGFTTLSSGMDAEETHAMLNGFFAVVDAVVQRFGGTIDKHIGDAVMAVFGAPVSHTDDPERALAAAIEIHREVARLEPPVTVHIGIAAGQVVASTTGSHQHTEYTVTGDSVNLAARLTDRAEGGETLVSGSVQKILGDRFQGEDLGEQLIRGMPEPVRVWRLAGLSRERIVSDRPFVGRHKERERFTAAVQRCVEQGKGETLVVSGEAGIGKSRLLQEFESIAAGQGFGSHTGLILDFGTARGQDAIRSLVRSLLGLAPEAGPDLREEALDHAIRSGWLGEERRIYLNDLLDLEQPPALRSLYDAMENVTRNWNKQESVAELVRSLSQQQSLLLKIEDLHWADPGVLDHAAHLARTAAQCPILLLMSTRPAGNPLDENWQARSGGVAVETIDLEPIDAASAAELAHSFPGVSESLLASCVERSGGNPLFLEQLLHNADELARDELPGSVQGIVQARVDALPSRDRTALQAASVLGQRFSVEALNAVSGSADYRPDLPVQQALVRPTGEGFHFAHALIRDAVYHSLLKPQRRQLHLNAARYYADEDPVLHAEHLDKAADPGAPDAYLAAARNLCDRFNFDRALGLTTRARALDCDTAVRFELVCLQGDLLRDMGRAAESITAFEEALDIAANDRDLCRANLGLAAGMRIVERTDEALACLDRIQPLAEQNTELAPILAELHFLRGNLCFPLGRIEQCRHEHETSLQYAHDTGSREAEARALGGLGDAGYVAGKMRTANGYFSRCVALAEKSSLKRIDVSNRPMLAWTQLYLNQLQTAADTALSAVEGARATGDGRAEIIAHNLLSEVGYYGADFDMMKDHGNQTLSIAQRIGATRFEAIGYLNRGRYELKVNGDRERALSNMFEAYEVCRATAEAFMGPWVLGFVAMSAVEREQWEWALAEGERIVHAGAVSHNFLFFYCAAMETCIENKDWERADGYADKLEQYTAAEPLEWSGFYVQRGRALAQHGRGRRDAVTLESLRQVREVARASGSQLSLHAIDAAVADY